MDTAMRRIDREMSNACKLPRDQKRERREMLTHHLFAGSTAITEIEDGFEYHFPGDADWAEQIVRFIVEERECCLFLRFEMTFELDQGPISLQVTGPEGTKQFLASQTGATS